MDSFVLQGNIVEAPSFGALKITEHGFLVVEDGRIAGVFSALPARFAPLRRIDYGDKLILQSLCDLHAHAPQYPMVGLGTDLPLLEWLERYAFPAEARFAEADYARTVSRRLARDLIRSGTTRVCLFSSLHREATLILMEELEKAGLTGYVGKVNMDRNGSAQLQETTEESERETLLWLDACSRFTHIKPILTPRFTPSCTDELMAFLGRLAAERDLPVQSHLSENQQEIAWVRSLHPDCTRYWESYHKFGLWTDRTLMAHCVHSDAQERAAMRRFGVTAVHCPDSNNALCSGIAPVRTLVQEGVRVALGSDVAGGGHLSMFDVAADAVRASKNRRILDQWQSGFLSEAEAWYLATSAGAAFFGAAPGFSPGAPLHALVLDDADLLAPHPLSVQERFQRCLYQRQDGAVCAVWSESRQLL